MERRVNYILVALFSLVLVAGFVTFVLWAHNRGGGKELRSYAIYFDQAVSGLSLGSSVRFLGVEIGHVESIDLDVSNTPRVRVKVGIDATIPMNEAIIATLKPSGITGVYFVDLRNDPTRKPTSLQTTNDGLMIIMAEPSDVDRLLGGASDSMQRLERVLARVEKLLNDDNLSYLAAMLKDGASASHQINAIMENLHKSGIDKEIGPAVRDLHQTIIETRDTARSITDLANSLNDNPSRILFGGSPQGVRIEP